MSEIFCGSSDAPDASINDDEINLDGLFVNFLCNLLGFILASEGFRVNCFERPLLKTGLVWVGLVAPARDGFLLGDLRGAPSAKNTLEQETGEMGYEK